MSSYVSEDEEVGSAQENGENEIQEDIVSSA